MKPGRVLFIAEKDDIQTYATISFEGAECSFNLIRDSIAPVCHNPPTLIVLDCGFDFQKGLLVLSGLKEALPGIPVIFLNGASSEQTVLEAFRAGAREYLKKPASISVLQNTVTNLLMANINVHEKRMHIMCARENLYADPCDAATTGTPVNFLRAVRYIEEHLSGRISLHDLARESCLSKYHFCRKFTQHFGASPMKYVTDRKLKRAKELLRKDGFTVSMVAFELGYQNPACLIRQFKKNTGQTPSRYRHSGKQNH